MAERNDQEWYSAPGSEDGAVIGRDTDSKIGFYGGTPIAKQTIPTAATGTQIAAALAALGLVNLS